MTSTAVIDPAATLKKNGKTFWFASLFLPKEMAADAAVLYSFCRSMDDLADEHGVRRSRARLERIRDDLRIGQSEDPLLEGLLTLRDRCALDLRAAECLLNVLLQDASEDVCIQSESELLQYCYGAAGTVGLMMSAVLQTEGAAAKVQAIDLGIAMQLTNIARDVLEDARVGRRYLPATWVAGLIPEQIAEAVTGQRTTEQIKRAIERLLSLADIFYGNAALGFDAIPPQARNGIRIAAAAYRHIGSELRNRGCDYTRGRVVVPLPKKMMIAAMVIVGRSDLEKLPGIVETDMLHHALAGLPGFA